MTLTAERVPTAIPAPPRVVARRRTVAAFPLLWAAALTGVAFGIRSIGLIRGFELWVDEMLYADLGASAARGEMPRLADGPFFLHPPGFFLVEGGTIRVFHIPTNDSMTLAYDLRWLTAVLGALTVGLAFLLIRRLAGHWPAVWGALTLSLEPFVLRINSRVFLETLAGLVLVAGLLLLVQHLQDPRVDRLGLRPRVRHRRKSRRYTPVLRLVAAGLLLGYAVFTKDVFAFFAVVPVLLAVVRRIFTGREGAVILAAAAVPYGAYLAVVASSGYLLDLARAKSDGLLRLVGLQDITGFNAPGSPSLASRLAEQAQHYGTSYAILLLCPLAGLVCVFSTRRARRLIGVAALVAGVYGAYMVAFGTAEEQYAYPIMIVGVPALAVVARAALDRGRVLRTAAALLMTLFLAAEVVLGVRLETTPDDGLRTFRSWAETHLPVSARVGATNGTSGYAFAHDPRFGPWATPGALDARGAQYVLTFDLPTRQGYTLARPELLEWLKVNATPLFRFYGPTNGETVLWYIDKRKLAVAAALAAGGPPFPSGADRPGTSDPSVATPIRGPR